MPGQLSGNFCTRFVPAGNPMMANDTHTHKQEKLSVPVHVAMARMQLSCMHSTIHAYGFLKESLCARTHTHTHTHTHTYNIISNSLFWGWPYIVQSCLSWQSWPHVWRDSCRRMRPNRTEFFLRDADSMVQFEVFSRRARFPMAVLKAVGVS